METEEIQKECHIHAAHHVHSTSISILKKKQNKKSLFKCANINFFCSLIYMGLLHQNEHEFCPLWSALG